MVLGARQESNRQFSSIECINTSLTLAKQNKQAQRWSLLLLQHYVVSELLHSLTSITASVCPLLPPACSIYSHYRIRVGHPVVAHLLPFTFFSPWPFIHFCKSSQGKKCRIGEFPVRVSFGAHGGCTGGDGDVGAHFPVHASFSPSRRRRHRRQAHPGAQHFAGLVSAAINSARLFLSLLVCASQLTVRFYDRWSKMSTTEWWWWHAVVTPNSFIQLTETKGKRNRQHIHLSPVAAAVGPLISSQPTQLLQKTLLTRGKLRTWADEARADDLSPTLTGEHCP